MTDAMDISVDCVVFGFNGQSLNVLLIKQRAPEKGNMDPSKLQMAIPGDLVRKEESLGSAAARILKDCTGLEDIYLKQLGAFGDPGRVSGLKDQEWLRNFRQHPNRRVVTVGYYSLINMEDYTLSPSPDSHAEYDEWHDVYSIPNLAFDHNEIVDEALASLRTEINTKHIGFELLPEKFTLSELQRLYEIILDKKMDKRNFRKNIKKIDIVEPLGEKQQGVDHKPAELFKFKK